MSPEAKLYLEKARHMLEQCHQLSKMGWYDAAGRAAYLCAFHAAQALIFERSGRAAKTHRGVQAQFQQLTADEPGIELATRRFLSRAYNLKTAADYETDPAAYAKAADVLEAAETASTFVQTVEALLRRN